ncbi:MAG: polysaccharide ABC transporter ATP-binding protein [Rhizomicrobium sp.]
MSDIVIKAEGVGKKYFIGHASERERYVALRDVVAQAAKDAWRKTKNLVRRREITEPGAIEEFWALKDVSFEIRRGDVLGIIGRNGAGKSTLLKILSRITEPTLGRVTVSGRVASLLEVGTGFHPELTGRENVFLNGAILGMSRGEIKRKFDEIVAFAEVDKFLDTPVKRYSSGMYVRLAFAVAAHLEPEILVVDEVLAVGDADFQEKCLGKMSDVANGGRTVLFVSHNLAAISALTRRCLWLDKGGIKWSGESKETIAKYRHRPQPDKGTRQFRGRGRHSRILRVVLADGRGEPGAFYVPGKSLDVAVDFSTDGTAGMSLELFLNDPSNRRLAFSSILEFDGQGLPKAAGTYRCEMSFAPIWLAAGRYTFDIATSIPNVSLDHYVENAVEFDVAFCNPGGLSRDYRHGHIFGSLALKSGSPPVIRAVPAEFHVSPATEPAG